MPKYFSGKVGEPIFIPRSVRNYYAGRRGRTAEECEKKDGIDSPSPDTAPGGWNMAGWQAMAVDYIKLFQYNNVH